MSSKSSTILIRDINQLSEMRDVEKLQKNIWGVEDLDVFPALALIPLKEVGAILIGAFDGSQMVGFVFGFPGLSKGQAIIHSDMLGVKPAYRSLGIGYSLKLAQRERALEMGIDKITWTFDPLQPRNAHLNFSKLGVIADRYEINFYGETSSFLHRFGTDRLWVTWLLNSERVQQRIAGAAANNPALGISDDIPTLVRVGSKQEPLTATLETSSEYLIVEIPGSFAEDQLALSWRKATREAFQSSLGSGYQVAEFWRESSTGINRYLLKRC